MSYDNRSEIVKQATRLFAARGYDAVGVQEIVDAVGITKPTLYHYFGNKRALLDALLLQNSAELRRELGRAAEYHGDLPLNLYDMARVYFGFSERQPNFYQLLLSLRHAPPESESNQAGAEVNEEILGTIRDLFAKALPHMEGRHHRYAITYIGMIDTYITLALNGFIELDENLMHSAVHQYMHGIYS